MIRVSRLWAADREVGIDELRLPLPVAPGAELELGFGKGRYLLRRAREEPQRQFVGIEAAPAYYRVLRRRASRQGLPNLVALCGEASYLLATCFEPGTFGAIHIYFPDPWPKERHHKRRLLAPVNFDLILRALTPTGRVFIATDHPDYGIAADDMLRSHPGLRLETVSDAWPDGARTNYEAKYLAEGRPIRRWVVGTRAPSRAAVDLLHPDGREDILASDRGAGAAAAAAIESVGR